MTNSMLSPRDNLSEPTLIEGSPLILHRDNKTRSIPIEVVVDHVDGELIWTQGSSSSVSSGDSVLVEFRSQEDARYMARGKVDSILPDRMGITCTGGWQLIQERSFVRISTYGMELTVPNPPQSDDVGDGHAAHAQMAPQSPGCNDPKAHHRFQMLDVSAGGLRFVSGDNFQLGDEFVCHFELPGQSCYVLPARVVRIQPKDAQGTGVNWTAIEFLDLSEDHRSELLRWIFAEQLRRHRDEG